MIRVLAMQARRDRIVLAVWVLGTALLVIGSARQVGATYGTGQTLKEVLSLALATPALLALRGVPNGATEGSAVHFAVFAFAAVVAALLNTFLAVRHGRGDEEAGRRELVQAAPVPRLAPFLATLVLGVVADAVLLLLIWAGCVSLGLPMPGALLFAAAIALVGLAFLGIGLVCGELMPTSRGANGFAVVLVLAAYALRAAGDALGQPDLARLTLQPAWPSALSPIGWGAAVLPFTADRPAPLLGLLALAVVTIAAAGVLRARRELGASVLPERVGPATASAALRSPLGLAWRLSRSAMFAWAIGSAVLGALTASLVGAVRTVRLDDPAIAQVARSLGHTRGDIVDALLSAVLVLVGLLASAAGVQAMLRAREEQRAGRAELTGALPAPRWAWLGSFLLVAVAAVLAVLVVTGAAIVLGYLAQGQPAGAGRAVGQTLVQLPAALSVVAAAAAVSALVPRLAVVLTWAVFTAVALVGLFGQLLGLPDELVRLSPIGAVPVLPSADWGPSVGVAIVAVLLALLAVLVARRRELVP